MSGRPISTEGFMLCILTSDPHLIHHILLPSAIIFSTSLLYFLTGMHKLLLAHPARQFLRVEHACEYSFLHMDTSCLLILLILKTLIMPIC